MFVYFLTCSCHKQLYIFCILAVFLNVLVCIFFHRKLRMAITRKDQGKPGKSRQGIPRTHDSKIIFQLSSRFRFSNCVGRLNSRDLALTHCSRYLYLLANGFTVWPLVRHFFHRISVIFLIFRIPSSCLYLTVLCNEMFHLNEENCRSSVLYSFSIEPVAFRLSENFRSCSATDLYGFIFWNISGWVASWSRLDRFAVLFMQALRDFSIVHPSAKY